MKLKQFLFAAVIAAMAGMTVVGCNENDPNDPTDPGVGGDVAPATNLQAVTLSSTSVGLRWTASTTTDVDEYRISVRNPAGTPVKDTTVGASVTSVTISSLTAGTIYTFGVTAVETDIVSGDDLSTEAVVLWSPAVRLTQDSRVVRTLRLYPRNVPDAAKGSGIVIGANGAYNTSVASGDLALLQLVANVASDGLTFTIGNPKSTEFSGFNNFNQFRTDVEVSTESVELDPTTGLNGWYRAASLAGMFGAGSSTKAFTFGDKLTSGNGVGFAVRWSEGTGQTKYARVYVKPGAGAALIQRDGGLDPYVEVEISSQNEANVPYAKGS